MATISPPLNLLPNGVREETWFNGQYGYQTDSDTNLQLLGHRYYDPTTGRFLTRDPAKDGTNWYDYVANNPERGTDPSGFDANSQVKLLLFIITAFFGRQNPPTSGQPSQPPFTLPTSHPVDPKHWGQPGPGPKPGGGDVSQLSPVKVHRGSGEPGLPSGSGGRGIDWGKVGEVAGGVLVVVVVVVVVVAAPEVAVPAIACAAAG